MTDPHPEVFYKYLTASTAGIVLDASSLRWSHPSTFSDPTEFQRIPRFETGVGAGLYLLPGVMVAEVYGRPTLDVARLKPGASAMLGLTKMLKADGMTEAEVLEALRSAPRPDVAPDATHRENLREFVENQILRNARVLCVTTDFANLMMWDHYAGRHSGCVLGFRHIVEKSTALLAAKPVAYTNSDSILGSGLDFLLYVEDDLLVRRSLDGIIYTKSAEYAYEREWRAVTWRSDGDGVAYGDYPFFTEELESVTFGNRTSAGDEAVIREKLRDKFPSAELNRLKIVAGIPSRIDAK